MATLAVGTRIGPYEVLGARKVLGWGDAEQLTFDQALIADLSGRRGHIGFQPPSTDGRYFHFKWRDDLGDIWVMDVR